MNITILTYDQAVARAILRDLASAAPAKSEPHVRAAATRKASIKTLRAEKLEALRAGMGAR